MNATPAVFVRCYEELNDHLPPHRRRRSFPQPIAPGTTVQAVLEAVGVPLAAVDLILVNGTSAAFSQRLHDGDRLSVYPVFEGFDIGPEARLPARPLRAPRFVVDAHLGRLAAYLRLLGFDTLYGSDWPDDRLVALSTGEGRTLLSRDRGLLARRALTHAWRVRAATPRRQLEEVVARFDLAGSARPFSRCLRCNAPLQPLPREAAAERLDSAIMERYREFRLCPGCGRIYWQGSHYRRMQRFLQELLARGPADAGPV